MPEPPAGPPPADVPPVALLRWPAEEAERRRLAALGEPRILVTTPGTAPPSLLDELELWVVNSADADAILAGIEGLRRKVRQRNEPTFEEGLLWFAGRWVSVPEVQHRVVQLLVTRFNQLVRYDTLRDAYRRSGGTATARSLRALTYRLGQRFDRVGLRLHNVQRQGVVLVPAHPAPPATPPWHN